ncbi:MAG TPA: addiction module protein [Fusobacteriaceae bacterium]|nr:addiction module protein [Fusobacteriaceae bacterium]
MLKKLPLPYDVESKKILKKVINANKSLAELKGLIESLPNKFLLLNTLSLREAKDSSEIENIVTTNDELYKANINIIPDNSATKEVKNYNAALKRGYELVVEKEMITTNIIIEIQGILEENNQGIRKTPGTVIQNTKTGDIVHRPPQNYNEIKEYMSNLEKYINLELDEFDPLVKLGIIHYQFESIHPFSDGNGRTGRILNILYLILNKLLDIPVLYLSSYIIKNKNKYYELLQNLNNSESTNLDEIWEEWTAYMLDGIENTSRESIKLIKEISELMIEFKVIIKREESKIYSKDFLELLFEHPYTKIEFITERLGITRQTASNYLDKLIKLGLLKKEKVGKYNFYINIKLWSILSK